MNTEISNKNCAIDAKLQAGDVAPDFSLPNEDSIQICLQDLYSHIIVLYFYPKDNTSGCTTQAQEFSMLINDFDSLNVMVIGVSPDTIATHKKFIEKHNLKITLLSDTEKKIANAYRAYGTKMMYGKQVQGIIRSTFVIQHNKIIESFYNVKAKGHAQKILDFICKYMQQ